VRGAQRTRTLWYRLYFKFVKCEHRWTATLGRSKRRERWKAQVLFLVSIETMRIVRLKWGRRKKKWPLPFCSDVTQSIVYCRRSRTVTSGICKVLECANPRGNGRLTKRARYELLSATRKRTEILTRIADILRISCRGLRITAPRPCSANDWVMTTWRNKSDSLFLSLFPYSGATDNRTVVRKMKALALSRTCATARTADFGSFYTWSPALPTRVHVPSSRGRREQKKTKTKGR